MPETKTTPTQKLISRDALRTMGKANLIGNGKEHLIPTYQPRDSDGARNVEPYEYRNVQGTIDWQRQF